MISSSFRQIHVTTRVSRFARLKKKIPWQILFIIYHIPYRRKPRLICTCMIPFQLRAMWTPDRCLRLCINPYVDHNTVRLQIFIDKNSSTLRTPYREQSVPNRPTDLLLSVRHRLSKSYFLSSWLILQTFR